ncbi:hypothetical protein BH11ACT1_BH11ACT1_22270 [soil metagenome]
MTAPDQLDPVHTANRRSFWISWSLMAVGVVALVLDLVVRSSRNGGSLGTVLLVAGVVVAACGAAMLVMSRSTGGRHDAVTAMRPESEVFEVWGAAGLRDALVAEGVERPRVRAGQGTALTMTTTASGFELWVGRSAPQVLFAAPWRDVTAVAEGAGVVANDGAKPAVVLVTKAGNELVLLPARKPAGSLMTAPLPVVRTVIARLEDLRVGA